METELIGISQNIAQIPENVPTELDRRLFHLKTLYDVSRELLGVVEIEQILKNFLFMTAGNYGIVEGFIFAHDVRSAANDRLVTIGIEDCTHAVLSQEAQQVLRERNPADVFLTESLLRRFTCIQSQVHCALNFSIDEEFYGILGLGPKIVGEPYNAEDKDLLETLVNNLLVSLKNARSARALKEAYQEVTILNRAKDKLIHHLSHELQTPVALLKSALTLLKRRLASLPTEKWEKVMLRAERSIQRLVDMQIEVEDIIQKSEPRNWSMISRLLDQCADALEILIVEQTSNEAVVEKIRNRIDEIFGPKHVVAEILFLDQFVHEQMQKIKPHFGHRKVEVILDTVQTPPIRIPSYPLEKLIIGIIKNAVENTPDGGRIEVTVKNRKSGVAFAVNDTGVGIEERLRKHIFEGFFPTQDPNLYSSKKKFDFNAGGKGADLLRLKIFSERYDFQLDMASTRCQHIPLQSDVCPGKISECSFCQNPEDCYRSGGTTLKALFTVTENLSANNA
jgi:K+-sensing histidine kinase KdpD